MKCGNKEVHAHDGVDSAVFLLQVKTRVGNLYEQVKETTNLVSINVKTVLINSLGGNIREQIEIWKTTTQTTLKWCY